MRVELKGQLLEAETECCEGKVQHRPGLTEWEACAKTFFFSTTISQVLKPDV